MAFNEQVPDRVNEEVAQAVLAMADADYPAYVMLMAKLEGLENEERLNGRFESAKAICHTALAMQSKYRDFLLDAYEANSPFSRKNWSKLTADQKAGRAPLPSFEAHPSKHEAA